jgi:hypothetical protein
MRLNLYVSCTAPAEQPRAGRCRLLYWVVIPSYVTGEARAHGVHLFNDRVGLVHLLYCIVVRIHVDAVSFQVQVGFNVKGRCLFRVGQPSVTSLVEC